MKNNHRAIWLGLLACWLGAASALASAPTGETLTPQAPPEVVASAQQLLSNADQRTTWDPQDATHITLTGETATIEGAGATVEGGSISITAPGTYVVSGVLADGSIAIDLTKEEKAQIVLHGADITCLTGAPLYATSCDKLLITLAEGTQNTLTDGAAAFTYANPAKEEPNATLFCKDDMTINGGGQLTVNAGFQNGIVSKNDLRIVGATLTVTAPNHALRGNDTVLLADATLTLTAGGDGIQTNNNQEPEKGWFLMEGGTVDITTARDGIQADTHLTVLGGKLTITAGGGPSMDMPLPESAASSSSRKGMKADGNLVIQGGDIQINSYDDCINAAGDVQIAGGTLLLATADDAIHSDSAYVQSGGSLTVSASFEALEAASITLTGGEATLAASDDGINAAGGDSGATSRKETNSDYHFTMTGGTLTLLAGGDGIDSNGDIRVSGGTLSVLISSRRDNLPLDANGSLLLTGGTLAYGGTMMGGLPEDDSTQSYVLARDVGAGQQVTLAKDGEVLLAFTPTLDCAYLALSTPEVAKGESYQLEVDGQSATAVGGITH